MRFVNNWVNANDIPLVLTINSDVADSKVEFGKIATGDYLSLNVGVSYTFTAAFSNNVALKFFDQREQVLSYTF